MTNTYAAHTAAAAARTGIATEAYADAAAAAEGLNRFAADVAYHATLAGGDLGHDAWVAEWNKATQADVPGWTFEEDADALGRYCAAHMDPDNDPAPPEFYLARREGGEQVYALAFWPYGQHEELLGWSAQR